MTTVASAVKHPLQRLNAPSREAALVLHVVGLASYSYSWWFISNFPNELTQGYGWHFQFLTIISLLLTTLTFVFSFFADISLSPRLFSLKNHLSLASTPLALLVSLLYWSISLIDKSLVVSPDRELSIVADLSLHLAPGILLAIDALLFSPPQTNSRVAVAVPWGVAIGYWFWIEECYRRNGWYPYPLMEQLDIVGRIALFALSAVLMGVCAITLGWAYGAFNGVEQVEKKKE